MFIPGFLISLATFPGVMVHELAHVAFCRITHTPVLKVCYFRVGNPAGYVIHQIPSTVWRHILIGIGPFFVNTLLGFVIGVAAIPMHIDFGHLTPVHALLLWLGVSIAMHSFPSIGDARSIWSAVWSKGAPITARVIGSPLVAIIVLGAIGSIVWLDALYGIGVVGYAAHLQKANALHVAEYAAPNDAKTATGNYDSLNAPVRQPLGDDIAPSISTSSSPSVQSTQVSFDQVIVKISSQINATCPIQVDKATRLDTTIAGPGNRLTYVYTLVGMSADEVDSDTLTAAVRPSIVNGYKTLPKMATLRANNVELHYLYRDKEGKHIGDIFVSPRDF
jgi:hypothetical protein